jgi:hypothetical protein
MNGMECDEWTIVGKFNIYIVSIIVVSHKFQVLKLSGRNIFRHSISHETKF